MNDFHEYIKRFQLDELIYLFSDISKEMYGKDEFYVQLPAYRYYGDINAKIGYVNIAVWSFHKIIYNAILCSNDYKDKVPEYNDAVRICNAYNIYSNTLAKNSIENYNTVELLFGLSQEQFWYQKKHELFEQINRNLELLTKIPKKIGSQIPVEEIVMEKLGLELLDFHKLLIAIFGRCSEIVDFTNITVDEKLEKMDKCFTKENVNKLINYYCIDYEGVRNSKVKEKALYMKPFVRTQRGRILAVNQFVINKKCSDGLYWIIRDYYNERKSQSFINEFGRYFENYFEGLLGHYLKSSSFERLKEIKGMKSADWAIYTSKYIMLIEQKSSLASISAKNEYPDLESLEKFFDNFMKAFIQLDASEELVQYNNDKRKIIKVALHYDELYVQSLIKDRVLQKCKDKISKTSDYFIISISEMERLIFVLSRDEKEYEQILDELVFIQENGEPGQGKELHFVLNKHKIFINDYTTNVINHTASILDELIRDLD